MSSRASAAAGDVAISVRGLGKAYEIRHEDPRAASLAETVGRWVRRPWGRAGGVGRVGGVGGVGRETFWALRGVSFDIPRGQVVGVVGRNGAGKSTLFKVLSRVTEPTSGEAVLRGRVGSLLEVGTGFHRELTGRENIYLNGAILGMTRREIGAHFDEIVAFAGTERFLDTPVKRYSSGMYVRLAFAVAAHLRTEILIVDEVLAVGDAAFQEKCLGKMSEVSRSGRTVLFVSHNTARVEALCDRCLWLQDGALRMDGAVHEVVAAYLGEDARAEAVVDLSAHPGRTDPERRRRPILRRLELIDGETGARSAVVPLGGSLRVRVLAEAEHAIRGPEVGICVSTRGGDRVFTAHTRFSGSRLGVLEGAAWIEGVLPDLRLMPGEYRVKVTIGDSAHDFDAVEDAAVLRIAPRDAFGSGRIPVARQGVTIQGSSWRMERVGGRVGEVAEV